MSLFAKAAAAASRVRPDPAPGSPEHAQALARLTFRASRIGVSFQPRYFARRPLSDAREFVLAAAATSAPPAPVPAQAPTPAEAALLKEIVGSHVGRNAGWADDDDEPTTTATRVAPAAPASPAKAAAPAPAVSSLDAANPRLAAVLAPVIATINARRRAGGKS